MFKAVKEQDSYKNSQTRYYLTKGDSCTITATPYKNGASVANSVSKCMFKLGNSAYKLEKEVEMTKSGESFVLNLTSAISATLTVGQYNYEIEYTMADGSVQTPHAWKFDIINEIQ
jgi:hypothetical protein